MIPFDISGFAGPRYDDNGNVIAHSILGSYDDFQTEAVKRGDLLVRAIFTLNSWAQLFKT